MADDANPFGVAPGTQQRAGLDVQSPSAPPGMNFTEAEIQIYDYICQTLRDSGIEHMTAGMPIAVIVRTYSQWLEASRLCEEKGRTQTAKSGWESPLPWADDEKRLKMELGQWLPKACLTIPSFVRVRKDTGAQGGQDDLFADLVGHGQSSPKPGLQH